MKRTFPLLMLLLFIICSNTAFAAEPYRFLVMGTDYAINQAESRNSSEISRADVILIVAIPDDGSSPRVLNIERDYLVELPEGLGPNKLNTASFFGGPEMLLKAVNNLFELEIQDYLQVSIPVVEEIIDVFGGVDINIFEKELSILSGEPGVNHFNGARAVAFMRERDPHIDPIISNRQRNERQMRVLSALMTRFSGFQFKQAIALVDVIARGIRTNITMSSLTRVARHGLDGGLSFDKITIQSSPSTDFRIRRMNMHFVVVADDMQSEIDSVRDFLLYP